jgi:hypothetical protein
MLSAKQEYFDMGEYDYRIAALRDQRIAAVNALDGIGRGATVTKGGVDITEGRRQRLQDVVVKLDAVIVAYEQIDSHVT